MKEQDKRNIETARRMYEGDQADMAPLTSWDFEVHDVMVNGNYVVATVSLQGERRGRKVDLRGAHIMRMNERG